MAIQRRALAALVGAFLASIAAWPYVPPMSPQAAMPRGGSGGWMYTGAPFIAFLLPLTAAIIWWLFVSLSHPRGDAASARRAPIDRGIGASVGAGAGAITVLFLSAFHVTLLIALIGEQLWLGRLFGAMAGMFLMVTGNELPRLRPNLVWGIRTKATLADDLLWRRVHRLGGFVRVAIGALVCVGSLVGWDGAAPLLFLGVGLETIICLAAGSRWATCSKHAA